MLYNALIRTHHITSKKKIAKLKKAANKLSCFALLRVGGTPGIMYVEGEKEQVAEWISTVQDLRYKDYQLAARVDETEGRTDLFSASFNEVAEVKEMAGEMESRGLLQWWREAMGYKTGSSS